MLFGLSYLFGLTGTTRLPELLTRLAPVMDSPVAIVALGLSFAGIFYKLAVFPFHFWTPDVYQGASNETASLIASLPKVGAVAVLVRFVALAAPEQESIALLLAVLAIASMFYGNLIALAQDDLKRLLGFSGNCSCRLRADWICRHGPGRLHRGAVVMSLRTYSWCWLASS